jgi:RNA polymerase sigma-70 factor (ECF subfamily)
MHPLEAMRLTYMLIENEQTNQPSIHALMALMCFYSSRFEARKNENGEIILYHDQDESLWNEELISRGIHYLRKASAGDKISKYHVEASIAYWHTIKADTPEKWESILQLFNQLLSIEYSPIAALNRTYAFSKVHGKAAAIEEAEKLDLKDNRFYFALLGELYKDIDRFKSKMNFHRALLLTKTQTDRQTIQKRIDQL